MDRDVSGTKHEEWKVVESGDFSTLFDQLDRLDCVAAYDAGMVKLARSLKIARQRVQE